MIVIKGKPPVLRLQKRPFCSVKKRVPPADNRGVPEQRTLLFNGPTQRCRDSLAHIGNEDMPRFVRIQNRRMATPIDLDDGIRSVRCTR